MPITSSRAALEHILAACVADAAHAPTTPERRAYVAEITAAARAGLAHYAAPGEVPAVAYGSAMAVLENLRHEARRVERGQADLLPPDWVGNMANVGVMLLGEEHDRERAMPGLTPAQRQAEKLLAVAFQYEVHLLAEFQDQTAPGEKPEDFIGRPGVREILELRVLLDPLRPPKPINPAAEALIQHAIAERIIGPEAAESLRDLARRMAK